MIRGRQQWADWILNSVALHEVKEMRENGWAAERINQALEAFEAELKPTLDWRMALAWYMFHVYHDQGTTFVRTGNGMNCMPLEFKTAIQEVYRELERMSEDNERLTKPDGSEW